LATATTASVPTASSGSPRVPRLTSKFTLINADAVTAEISGQWPRCVAAYWFSPEEAGEKMNRVTIQTDAAQNLPSHPPLRSEFEFETEMGQAIVSDPLSYPESGPVQGHPISTGNPHYVIFVDDFSPTGNSKPPKSALTAQSFNARINVGTGQSP